MKKKLLSILLAVVMILPVIARADMIKPRIYYTDKTVVGGIVKESVVLYDQGFTFDELVINYDTEYLSIDKSDVKVMLLGEDILKDANNGSVTVDNGKITLKVTNVPKINLPIDGDLVLDSTSFYVDLSFKALKEGETKVTTVYNTTFYGTEAKISIKDGKAAEKEESKEEKKEEPTKEEKKNKDLIMYISLGANAVLLIALIIVAAKKKKTVEPKASE